MRARVFFVWTVASMAFLAAEAAYALPTVLDFESLMHGEIVGGQFSVSHGVTISATNIGGGPDLAIAFDSTKTGTADPDLEDPWTFMGSTGNIPEGTILGKVLIIAENDEDKNNDNLIDSPDDEGSRPAGSIFFDFDFPLVLEPIGQGDALERVLLDFSGHVPSGITASDGQNGIVDQSSNVEHGGENGTLRNISRERDVYHGVAVVERRVNECNI